MAKSATGIDPIAHFDAVYGETIPGFGNVPPYRPVDAWRVLVRGFEPLILSIEDLQGLTLEDVIQMAMRRPVN